jgi:hypothetical protein
MSAVRATSTAETIRRGITVAAVLGGCLGVGVASAGAPDKTRVRAMVLTSRAVPPGFVLAAGHSYDARELAAQGTWKLSQLRKWGYIAGYESQYVRDPAGDYPGQLSSDAGAYRTASGAQRSLAANADACHRGLWQELPLSQKVGARAHLCMLVTRFRGALGQVFFVVWRKGRFKGAITLTGLKDHFTAGDAVRLAKGQARRMK